MRHPRRQFSTSFTAAFLAVSVSAVAAFGVETQTLDRKTDIPFVSATKSSPVTVSIQQNRQNITLHTTISGLHVESIGNATQWRIENEGIAGVNGRPDLPAISRWVCVPDRGKISLRYTLTGEKRFAGSAPSKFADGEEGAPDLTDETPHWQGVWPPDPVIMGEPKVWRGVRMVNVVIYPIRWDADRNEYIQADVAEVSLETESTLGINEVRSQRREACADFVKALRALVVNPPVRDDADEAWTPGSYLVVANEDPPAAVDEFVQAKRQAGHIVELLTFNGEATPKETLKDMIRERYIETGFSFLVLMGNEEVAPPLQIPFDNTYYDNYFGQLDGDDEIADVAVGSYNCQTIANLTCAIRRTLAYEYDPTQGGEQNDWFQRAFVGVGHCSVAGQDLNPSSDFSPSYAGMWVQEVLERNRFDVESTYFVNAADNDFSPDVADQYNNGVNLVIVRGHQSDFDADEIQPGSVYPFHFMVSSSTISPGQGGFGGSFNRTYRMGTPNDMRGPSSGFGHYPSPVTNYANAIVGGLTEAIFLLDIKSFGWARNYLTANLARVMPADQGNDVTRYWGTLRYYGDPGQEPWINPTDGIRNIDAPENISLEATTVTIGVHGENEAITDARVALYQPNGIQLVKTHALDVNYSFTWPHGALTNEPITVTITHPTFLPVQRVITINDEHEFISVIDAVVERNGEMAGQPVQSGDPFRVYLSLMNESPDAIDGVEITLQTNSEWAAGSAAAAIPEQIAPGQQLDAIEMRQADQPLHILPGCPDGERICCLVAFSQGDVLRETGSFEFEVIAPTLQATTGDVRLEPGEDAQLSLAVTNTGRVTTGQLTVVVESLTDLIGVENGAFRMEPVSPEDEGPVQSPEFTLQIPQDILPSYRIPLRAIFSGEPGVQDTINFEVRLRNAEEGEPLGPGKYGYIALDDGDDGERWGNRPVYRWLNISPWGGEFNGEALDFPVQGEVDSSVVVELPFEFRYYGQGFRQITVCNNGWIAMGDQSNLKNQQNWPLPGYDGAYGMIAPFWDRLEMQTRSDGVFIFFDEANAYFVIQWQTGTLNEDNQWLPNAFEVVLFDPARYQTPTGDSPILFQYENVNNVQARWEANCYCTVGISSPDGLDGLTYSYWNIYPPGAAELRGGRAILWTTDTQVEPAGRISVVEGSVVRYIDSTAVANAIIRSSTGQSTISGRDGAYHLLNVPPGRFDLTVEAAQYDTAFEEAIEIAEGETIQRDFVLAHGWVSTDYDSVQLFPPIRDRDESSAGGEFRIENIGNSPTLAYFDIIIPDSNQWDPSIEISFHPDSVEIRGADPVSIGVSARADQSGEFVAELAIRSDSPAPEIRIPLLIWLGESVDPDQSVPLTFNLQKPYPNPFNSTTLIQYQIPKDSRIRLALYDLGGRQVDLLIEENQTAGYHSVTLSADDLTSGLYILRMEAGSFSATERLLLIK